MSGCWVFMGGLNKDGYGMIWHDGQMRYVHHLTHDLTKGRPRPGFERDHKCKIRCCCNPDHLEAVTPFQNAARGDWHKFCAVMPSKDWIPNYEVEGDPFALV
jgi:ABC-type nickel/cobalt efflux system permease component RcnA